MIESLLLFVNNNRNRHFNKNENVWIPNTKQSLLS